MKRVCAILLCMMVLGCVGIPENIRPVSGFDSTKYLGRWYEIARLDHSFERGLTQITADYSESDDGSIKVINRGYAAATKEWKEAQGKAYFVENPTTAYLKVSFFGPFYGSYIIFDLDKNYQYSLVCGPDKSYFWILSRSPQMDRLVKEELIQKAERLGFDTKHLIDAQE
jgi:apolipoprotein D and lipocalin family protein